MRVKNPKGAEEDLSQAIAIDPDAQRSGYGKILMEYIRAIAFQKGYNKMHLIVNSSNINPNNMAPILLAFCY